MGRFGWLDPALAPTEIPAIHDIAWAAGFYEGEGCVSSRGMVRIGQKDPWVLKQMRELYGGTVAFYDGMYSLSLNGSRARGFLMSIYGLLSPRRQEQIRNHMKFRSEQCDL